MPCLLDLPPELIEQIYDPSENDNRDLMVNFRLTCKYIEKATRRSFRRWYFAWRVIKMNDASIERFCGMTQTPDLTKSLEELEIHAEDDGTTARKARENRNGVDTSSTDHFTLTTLESPSQLVPELLLRHSDALLAALSATENLRVFIFHNKVCLDDQELSDDYMSANFSSLPNSKEFLCDITATLDFFLALAERAGRCLKHIWSESDEEATMVALTDLTSLVTRKQALLKLQNLELDILSDCRSGTESAEVAYKRIGQQLYDCVGNFSALERLTLNFYEHDKTPLAWQIFAAGPPFPALSTLTLVGCYSSVEDFGSFIIKYCATLKALHLFHATLNSNGRNGYKDLHVLFTMLATFPLLEDFHNSGLHLDGVQITFPDLSVPTFSFEKDEDGWVEVQRRYGYQEFDGRAEVQEGLRQMAQILA